MHFLLKDSLSFSLILVDTKIAAKYGTWTSDEDEVKMRLNFSMYIISYVYLSIYLSIYR